MPDQARELDLAALKGRLYSAVLSDVLDGLGHPDQAVKPFVRPLDEASVLCGFARTGLYMKRYHFPEGHNPYALEMDLIDSLKPGEIPVLACDGPTDRIAPWGELLTTASKVRGAAGCLTDGLVRDVRRIRELGFPVFHGGIGPLDTKGRAEMMAADEPVEVGGARVAPGDFIFGDVDGVVIVPRAIAPEAIRLALAKIEAEDSTREELLAGNSLRSVFERHGVL
ncbi:Regulator of RNase E activity RraA [Bosea sp. 62]|uniref:RraA family protein n=1 Tax=unclassified Bosea (in: a-proteobacteria) TaxID=2653178 RepID=UPI00125585FA|nr:MULTISPECIES: RraA family protein [unclassified Bosea (in: a-proteobacteria)]CAD5255577.1 Regulator of RNase E activity RraA [Bosea sp. 21B]CAD5284661.1 Regulator of RNase E activity RraA [Bosea sp. 7B]CAD5301679.1 Regulator of RNase E activity RraA [Bosea sp. 46]VVT57798.1 Regulator of RNase E activity RraA [Bosea sp. EC-HK365B]VXB31598.1 Regulator of RNase E activity RraA [Bosea sp. 29B]